MAAEVEMDSATGGSARFRPLEKYGVKSGILAQAATIRGRSFAAGTMLRFSTSGAIESPELSPHEQTRQKMRERKKARKERLP
jgi:hypothetical protein